MARKQVEASAPVDPVTEELVATPVDPMEDPVRLQKMAQLYALAADPDQQEAFYALRDELNASA